MERFVSIAIDGPAGAGKSTVAKACAAQLGYLYVDTGAIYRTVGLYMKRAGVDPADCAAVAARLDDVHVDIVHMDDGVQHMFLAGEDVTGEIRTPEMSWYASCVSAHAVVRSYLMETQRRFARTHSVVMDGRDIGTVVLPDADVKIFLTASAEVRAMRRMRELRQKGQDAAFEQVLQDMRARDRQDSERAAAPLRQAEDAVLLDTSGLSIDQTVDAIKEIVRRKLG